MRIKHSRLLLLALAIGLLLVGCVPVFEVEPPVPNQELIIHFIDVGQGDATLLQFPSGKNMLIDAGSNSYAQTVIDYLQQEGVQRLDYCIGTHPHEDHIGALDDVILAFPIGNVYLPNATHTTRAFENLLTAIKDKNLKIKRARAGVNIDAGSTTKVEIIAPISNEYSDLNDYSVVVKVTYGQTSIMITGDADKVSEAEMVKGNRDLAVDLLQVSHHGSRRSSSQDFLDQAQPKHAVISVGQDNMYGHPHAETLKRLAKVGATVYRTDLMGTIVFKSDGQSLTRDAQPGQNKRVWTQK